CIVTPNDHPKQGGLLEPWPRPAVLPRSAADVAGYSRLMGADEEGTHERLKAVRRQLVDPKIKEHHGRIVKTTGDGMLAEFPSVVDAVRCAVEIQRAMVMTAPRNRQNDCWCISKRAGRSARWAASASGR